MVVSLWSEKVEDLPTGQMGRLGTVKKNLEEKLPSDTVHCTG